MPCGRMGRMKTDETIGAMATPARRGGRGGVRLSGAAASSIARQILKSPRHRTKNESLAAEPSCQSWHLHLAEIADEQGRLIDRVLVSYFAKPRSYTGEDVVEISCHGSPVVLRYLLEHCLAAGARLARPGE